MEKEGSIISAKGKQLAMILDLQLNGSAEEACVRVEETTSKVLLRRSQSVPKSKKELELRRLNWNLTEKPSTNRRTRLTWHVPLTTTLRGGAEAERCRMMSLLAGLEPRWLSQGPPAPVWELSTSGAFSVRSFYNVLQQQG
ncbi:hypothetical protein LINPERHAP2_LOCUS35493, partial [Linum perenne]